jgi:hypothetical protein
LQEEVPNQRQGAAALVAVNPVCRRISGQHIGQVDYEHCTDEPKESEQD